MTRLIYFGKSTRDKKRFVAVFDNPRRTVHFGLLGAKTYIDGVDASVRSNYLKRHAVDLRGDVVKAGYLSYYVTWGKHRDVEKNMLSYLKKFNIKDKR